MSSSKSLPGLGGKSDRAMFQATLSESYNAKVK